MPMRPFLAVLFLVLAGVSPALARTAASPVPASAEPLQFYVFSFTETPIAEAAQDIVGGALAYDLEVDPAVEGIVSFRADGWSTGEALLKEFGEALLDQDVALMRTSPGAYAVVPRTNVPMMLARGGVLMALPEPVGTAQPSPAPVTGMASAAVYGGDRWWDGAFTALMIFFTGALAGGAALLAGQTVYRRAESRTRIAPPTLRLTDQRTRLDRPADIQAADPDLVIPRFEDSPRQR